MPKPEINITRNLCVAVKPRASLVDSSDPSDRVLWFRVMVVRADVETRHVITATALPERYRSPKGLVPVKGETEEPQDTLERRRVLISDDDVITIDKYINA